MMTKHRHEPLRNYYGPKPAEQGIVAVMQPLFRIKNEPATQVKVSSSKPEGFGTLAQKILRPT
jgi:hypothetical protein